MVTSSPFHNHLMNIISSPACHQLATISPPYLHRIVLMPSSEFLGPLAQDVLRALAGRIGPRLGQLALNLTTFGPSAILVRPSAWPMLGLCP